MDRAYDTLPLAPGPAIMGWYAAIREDALDAFRRIAEAGPLVRYRMAGQEMLLVNDADGAHTVFVSGHEDYEKTALIYGRLRLLLGDGLVTAEGPSWKRQRRLVNPAFHRERIQALGDVMQALALDTLERWGPWAASGAPFDLSAETSRFALRVAGQTLMGADVADDASEVASSLTVALRRIDELMDTPLPLAEYLPTPANLAFYRARARLFGLVDRVVAERLAAEDPGGDLLGMLVAAHEDGDRLDARLLRDEVLTLLLAGHETTATALAWTVLLLADHPEVRSALQTELDALPDPVGAKDLGGAPLLDRVLAESLRLQPPIWGVARTSLRERSLCGVRVPEGTMHFLLPWLLHRHPAYWADPAAFRPDRWLDPGGIDERAYLPFLAGPRMCVGKAFALLETKLFLANALRRYTIEVLTPRPVPHEAVVTLRPKNGLRVRARRRR